MAAYQQVDPGRTHGGARSRQKGSMSAPLVEDGGRDGEGRRLILVRLAAVVVAGAVVLALVLVAGRGGGSSQSASAGALGAEGSAAAAPGAAVPTNAVPAHSSGEVSTAPDGFVLPQLDGTGEVRLLDFRGRPTVVNFFASWCTACEGELPGMARVSAALKGTVNFVGVDSMDGGDGLAMARRLGVGGWPLARDVEGAQSSGLHDALNGVGMPITAFYDAAGKLRFVSQGALTEDALRQLLHDRFGVAA